MANFIDTIYHIIKTVNGFIYFPVLIILLLGVGIYFTFRTGLIQLKLFQTFKVLSEAPSSKGGVSSFQALMVSTASRVGTGNIVGVSAALCLGGPGALFWMWIVAIIGGASAFIESTLAQIYKHKDENGDSYGGPAYYIQAGLKSKFLASAFALSLIACYAVGFNMLASYNIQSSFSSYSFYNPQTTPMIIGGILALLTAFVILGGGKSIIHVTEKLVPLMGILYVLVSLLMIVMNIKQLPEIFSNIFQNALDFKAIFGGLAGSSLIHGIKRGLYSNEAGMGSAPNAAAAADVSHPVKQGLVQMLSVFLDTLVICSATAFMGLSSGVVPTETMAGAPYIQEALSTVFGQWGYYFISLSLILFGFTTLIGNLYYVESNIIYLVGKVPNIVFQWFYRIIFVILIYLGAVQKQAFVWDMADLFMGIMALINLPVIIILGNQAIKALKDYNQQDKAGQNPVFKSEKIGLNPAQFDFWK
ncbi:alanine/glycine:cation symporter family protein [Facklamia miroungae]|uniref:Alanine or glycine:cation symporter, AGCS family n=1 Tax=Facklamia miroungae TaxID=120956 RepID=A0A1G7V566_9LACT|nr:alanine/glycine:cation symporter family protein [Facklamia miroungae]NKZ30246.1 alanine:cation symporter family protein [Facklamia miroungae]SDG55025.1 alanine or glycine:cation symporter, AGCS family [Facklamia miroungae]